MAPGCALKLGNQRKQKTAIRRLEAGRSQVRENYLVHEPDSIGRPAHLRYACGLTHNGGSTCAANARLREPNGMPLSGRGGTCATLLFNLATTMVFCRSVNEMIAF
jgi:hypothetical protein